MTEAYIIAAESSEALTFRIDNPLQSHERQAVRLSDLLATNFTDASDRAAALAKAEERFERAALAKLRMTDLGAWVDRFGGPVQWRGRAIFLDDGPLLLTFENARAAMFFKLTWA